MFTESSINHQDNKMVPIQRGIEVSKTLRISNVLLLNTPEHLIDQIRKKKNEESNNKTTYCCQGAWPVWYQDQ